MSELWSQNEAAVHWPVPLQMRNKLAARYSKRQLLHYPRLRFEVKDYRQVNEQAVKAAGATGIIRPGKNACQVIVGTNVKSVYDELDKLLK